MKYKSFQNINLSRLGLGNMRLPLVDPDMPNSYINYEEAHKIIDRAKENGINYFDTAYVYNNGDSEKCLGACMTKYPRDSFYLADKFNHHANPDYEAVFEEQLKRLQTDHIDFYLLHCILDGNADGHKVKCPWCGEDREDQISYQFWATLGSSTIKYRCRSCNKYMRMYGSLCCRAEADD